MTVTAPPRPPRSPGPSDPVDRDELEALVEALIEEARQRARRRRRIYAAVATLVALLGIALFTAFERTAQSQTASPELAVRSSLPAGATSSKLAFISHTRSACCGPGPPFELYVDERRREREAGADARRLAALAWSPDGQKIAFVGGRTTADDLRHQRRRQRATEADAQRGTTSRPAWSPDGRKIAFSRE